MRPVAGLVIGLVCSAAFATDPVQRTLSFEDRVKAQTAIERVYYSHQVGATKPFDEAVPKAVIEAKVRKYLEQSAALQRFWKTPVTDQSLQRELERMAAGTRMPERLQELYAALGNDAFLVKECLARATLVDRLTHNFYAFDPTMHAKERAQAEELHRQLVSGELSAAAENPSRTVTELVVAEVTEPPTLATLPMPQRVAADEFKTRRAELPRSAGDVSAVEETEQAFTISVVLSETAASVRVARYAIPKIRLDDWWVGARRQLRSPSVNAASSGTVDLPVPRRQPPADPLATCADDRWDNGSLQGVPSRRQLHSAVWTGSLMLIWGGESGYSLNTGARYDPATDAWTAMSKVGAPEPRTGHTAIWANNLMVVWGGNGIRGTLLFLNSGGRYDPLTDTWAPTTKAGAPTPRYAHSAVWTGSRMVIWGGTASPTYGHIAQVNTGSQYDPVTDHWTPTSVRDAPYPQANHTAVWTGSLMMVWGRGAAKYNPSTDRWTPISELNAPPARDGNSVIWTGSRMIVWGGVEYYTCNQEPPIHCPRALNTGAVYDPVSDAWAPTTTTAAPFLNQGFRAVWTGSLMLVWGSSDGLGARYDPSTDSWTPMAASDAPLVNNASVVWAGTRMIVWGGQTPSYPFFTINTGGRYDPVTDAWTPTANQAGPGFQLGETAVWTGNEMVVWGAYFSAFGRGYDPVVDSWREISASGAPSQRTGHTAVWTGNRMVVWGGAIDSSGGRYDPVADAWSSTAAAGAPSPRGRASAVWTGGSMLVWGGSSYDGEYHFFNSGGRYDPENDTWLPMSVEAAPSGREYHSAIWTGSRMVVWGGSIGGSVNRVHFNTGALYEPASDSWSPTSTIDAPSPRDGHSAVWTGNRMIVWGGDYLRGRRPVRPGYGSLDTHVDRYSTVLACRACCGLDGQPNDRLGRLPRP